MLTLVRLKNGSVCSTILTEDKIQILYDMVNSFDLVKAEIGVIDYNNCHRYISVDTIDSFSKDLVGLDKEREKKMKVNLRLSRESVDICGLAFSEESFNLLMKMMSLGSSMIIGAKDRDGSPILVKVKDLSLDFFEIAAMN